MKNAPQKIVFYDGDCGFCNRSVQLIMRFEKHQEIHFSTLQSPFAQKYFEEKGLDSPDMSTFFYSEDGELLQKSAAAFRVAKHFRFPYNVIRIFSLLPQWLTDQGYNLIAKYRNKIAGTYCVIPDAKQKKRFLDK